MFFIQQRNFYCPKKLPKRLEPISEINSVSDDNNNTKSSEAEQIPVIFNGLKIDDNHQSKSQPTTVMPSIENAPAKVPLTTQPIDSAEMNDNSLPDQNAEENLDDSVILIEPEFDVIEVSFEGTIRSMNFSALSTDDSTDEECVNPKEVNSKISWSDRGNVRLVVCQQQYIKQKIVDAFFGGDSINVDLYEIFPDIEPRSTIRRKSSVLWTTPPRYSMLPKY